MIANGKSWKCLVSCPTETFAFSLSFFVQLPSIFLIHTFSGMYSWDLLNLLVIFPSEYSTTYVRDNSSRCGLWFWLLLSEISSFGFLVQSFCNFLLLGCLNPLVVNSFPFLCHIWNWSRFSTALWISSVSIVSVVCQNIAFPVVKCFFFFSYFFYSRAPPLMLLVIITSWHEAIPKSVKGFWKPWLYRTEQ